MKALVTALVSIAILVTSWGIFVNYSDKSIHRMMNSIEDDILVSVYAENWDKAEEQISALSKKWHKNKKVYSYFFNTIDLNETDYSIARAKSYIDAKNVSLSVGELSCIKEQLGFLHLNELASADNIF